MKLNKIIMLILTFILLVISVSAIDTGDGTEGDPYLIKNCTDLQSLGSGNDEYYKLNNNIDCSGTLNYSNPSLFRGNLNGNGKQIFNVTSINQSLNYNSLLGQCNGAQIYNLKLNDVYIDGSTRISCLCGESRNTTITNVFVEDCTLIDAYSGGVIGSSIAGTNYIINVSVNMYSDGVQHVGGLVGAVEGGNLEIFTSRANITAKGTYTGGLVGSSTSTGYVNITDSYVYQTYFNNANEVGGILGRSFSVNQFVNIKNSYAVFVKQDHSDNQIGGLVGEAEENVTIINSYWDLNITNTSTMCGISSSSVYCNDTFGKTTSELYLNSTFTNWDFNNVWTIDEGLNYPYLELEYKIPTIYNISDCQNINVEGYYNLTQNINIDNNQCFNIQVNNSVFDCKGYSITATNGTGHYAFGSNNLNNFTLKNCIIKEFGGAIYSQYHTNNINLYNNTVLNNLDASSVWFTRASNINIIDNKFLNGVGDSTGIIEAFDGINLYIHQNLFENQSYRAFNLVNQTNPVASYNTFKNLSINPSQNTYAECGGSLNCTIFENYFYGVNNGICFQDALTDYSIIRNNYFFNCGIGIKLLVTRNVEVHHNNIVNSSYTGILTENQYQVADVYNNNIYNGYLGIDTLGAYLNGSVLYYFYVYNNTIYNNYAGLSLQDTDTTTNTYINNNIYNNNFNVSTFINRNVNKNYFGDGLTGDDGFCYNKPYTETTYATVTDNNPYCCLNGWITACDTDLIPPSCELDELIIILENQSVNISAICSDNTNLTYFNVTCQSKNYSFATTDLIDSIIFNKKFVNNTDSFTCQYYIEDEYFNANYTQRIRVTHPDFADWGTFTPRKCPISDNTQMWFYFLMGAFILGLFIINELMIKLPILDLVVTGCLFVWILPMWACSVLMFAGLFCVVCTLFIFNLFRNI